MASAKEESERYHREYYSSHTLFEQGTWLERPNATLLEIGEILAKRESVRILDLGAGVGRNAIPLAKILWRTRATIDCVDILDIAVNELTRYSEANGVRSVIHPVISDIGSYPIEPDCYDLIMAMSALEHSATIERFGSIIEKIQRGTRVGGINCFSIATDLEERDSQGGEKLPPLVEAALSKEMCESFLEDSYYDWKIEKLNFSRFEQSLQRKQRIIDWSANYCLFVAVRGG